MDLLSKNNGKPPVGHKTAQNKAFAKFIENQKAARPPKVNTFAENTEDEDSSYEEEEFDPMNFSFVSKGTSWADARVEPETPPQASVNSFSAIAPDSDDEVATLEQLNGWAVRVNHIKNKKVSQSARKTESRPNRKIKAVITNEAEFENLIAALPKDWKGLQEAAEKAPKDVELAPGETWCMFDTGANIDAADIEEHFRDFVPFIQPVTDRMKDAESACGGMVKTLGTCKVVGTIDGQEASINFRHMKVKIPIASGRNRVRGKNGNDVFITEGGGFMKNRRTGRIVQLYDRSGVLFFKFKPDIELTRQPDQVFGRQG